MFIKVIDSAFTKPTVLKRPANGTMTHARNLAKSIRGETGCTMVHDETGRLIRVYQKEDNYISRIDH